MSERTILGRAGPASLRQEIRRSREEREILADRRPRVRRAGPGPPRGSPPCAARRKPRPVATIRGATVSRRRVSHGREPLWRYASASQRVTRLMRTKASTACRVARERSRPWRRPYALPVGSGPTPAWRNPARVHRVAAHPALMTRPRSTVRPQCRPEGESYRLKEKREAGLLKQGRSNHHWIRGSALDPGPPRRARLRREPRWRASVVNRG